VGAPERRLCTPTAKSENRIGLVNEIAVWIHHVAKFARFCPVAFIFDERQRAWLIVGVRGRSSSASRFRVNLMLNPVCFKTLRS
jgi:hypothetical protein